MAGTCWLLTKVTRYVYVAKLISLIPFRTGNFVRYYFYKWTLAKCGQGITINFGSIISNPDSRLGSNIWIGTCNILGTVDIGDWVITAQGCHIPSGKNQHDFSRTDIPIMKQEGMPKMIKLKGDTWVGAGAIILSDIGQGCVIGAGSVVTKDIPDFCVAAGNPALVLRSRMNARE